MAVRSWRSGSSHSWRELRAAWARRLPLPCLHCGEPVDGSTPWALAHPIPRSLGGRDEDARPAHRECNRKVGDSLNEAIAEAVRERLAEVGPVDPVMIERPSASPAPASFLWGGPRLPQLAAPQSLSPDDAGSGDDRPEVGGVDDESPGVDDGTWDAAPWLDELRAVPADARWPRLMTAPHPSAVGSYGAEAIADAERRAGMPLRWWQQLVMLRGLEHDDAGELVWPWWLLSTARQVGKSWLLRELIVWRIRQAERFGEPQLALHSGKDLPVCREVQRPARAWARGQTGYIVREANGMEEIELPDGSRWIIRGKGSVYGYSSSLAAIDEAWKVDSEVVEDGIEPTMAERASSQLLLLSTAHRAATPLMPTRRAGAIDQLAAPRDTLIVEWSARGDSAVDDRAGWRLASPYWSTRRERLVEAQHRRAARGGVSDDPDEPDPIEAFRSQWLNIWPGVVEHVADDRIEPLLDGDAWVELADLGASVDGPLVVAIEDYYGRGAAVAAAGRLADGRTLVWGRAFGRRAEARTFAASLVELHAGSRLVVAPALDDDELGGVAGDRTTATAPFTRAALARLRELVHDRAIVHDGGAELVAQLVACRVRALPSGLAVWPSGRTDLVRAVAWAVATLDRIGELIEDPAIY